MRILAIEIIAICLLQMEPRAWCIHCPSLCVCKGNFEVYCNNTGLTAIPDDIPKETTYLSLEFNKLRTVPKRALAGLNKMTAIDLSSNSLHGNAIEAGALELPSLSEVNIAGNEFTQIPTNLPRNLTSLIVGDNPITLLDTKSFANYTSITVLDLYAANLTQIMPHSFDMLTELEILNIGYSPLTNDGVPDDMLAKNTRLTDLSLRFNRLTSVLPDLPVSLQQIDYVGNNIQVIPPIAFKNNVNLEILEFWNGHVKTIEDNAFAGLSKLQVLDLMNGNMSSPISKSTFNGLISLRTLYLDLNQIPSIAVGALHDLGNMSSLWLSGNNLTTLQEGVLDTEFIPHLTTLYIDYNPWYCDCLLRWLREKVGNASYVIQDPHLIVCHGPPKVAGKAWDVLRPEDFVCGT